jgi:dimethylargininase
MRFENVIVRKPSKSMVEGLSSANLGIPNYELAVQQHEQYINALLKCGVDVTILDVDENFPDSCFIEDVALCTPHCAIITRPGAVSRRGEVEEMPEVLKEFYENIELIQEPGTIEAGDIMMVENHYYIGLSERTNQEGADQMITFLEKYGMTGSVVTLEEVLHLKTGLAYLENNHLVISGEFLENKEFDKFNKIIIDEKDAYSANCIWVNNKVIIPAGYPNTKAKLEKLSYELIELDMSEFQKLDGGLSCLSLRF